MSGTPITVSHHPTKFNANRHVPSSGDTILSKFQKSPEECNKENRESKTTKPNNRNIL